MSQITGMGPQGLTTVTTVLDTMSDKEREALISKAKLRKMSSGDDSPVTMQDLLKEYSKSQEKTICPTGVGHSIFGNNNNRVQADTFETDKNTEEKSKPFSLIGLLTGGLLGGVAGKIIAKGAAGGLLGAGLFGGLLTGGILGGILGGLFKKAGENMKNYNEYLKTPEGQAEMAAQMQLQQEQMAQQQQTDLLNQQMIDQMNQQNIINQQMMGM